jgi:NADH-quinone oxidoreductase chain G
MDQRVTLQIDGRDISVPAGTTVLEAAARAGIEIPSLCYQEKLLPAGLCRLCLVEIESAPCLQAACATVACEGMVVRTDTPPVLHNRRMVLELLCTNHPLDCPVCDAAGDCRLQDYVFRYGRTVSRFVEEKRRKGKAIDLGPAVVLDQERCVLCQRCVRFCEQILDDRQIGVFQRSAASRIATLPGRSFDSAFSGNVIDLCPVGAMTSRVFRFKARTWELESVPSTCGLCPVGCQLTVEGRGGWLLRLRGREAPETNDGWLCDLGRTGHGFVDSPDRLRRPLLRRGDQLLPATWDEALEAVANGLGRVVAEAGPHAVAALGSPRLTNEAAYLLSKLMRVALGTNNVDCRLGTAIPAPVQATTVDLRQADTIVLFQADPGEEAPIVELWVRQAARRGAALYVVHPRRVDLSRHARQTFTPRPGTEALLMAGALAVLARRLPAAWRRAVSDLGPAHVASLTGCGREAVSELATALSGAARAVLAYGAGVRDEQTVALLAALAEATGARLLGWSSGPNTRGVADMGLRPDRLPGHAPLDDAQARQRCQRAWGAAVPSQAGVGAAELWGAMQRGEVRALYVAGADPLSEAPDPRAIDLALASAFLVVQDAFLTPTAARADVVLPAAVFGEEDGSLTNLAGRLGWQRRAIAPLGEARPHWQVLAQLAQLLQAPGTWSYSASADVLAEVARVVPAYAGAGLLPEGGACEARVEYTVLLSEPEAPRPALPALGGLSPHWGDLALIAGAVLFDRDVLASRSPAIAQRALAPYVMVNPADAVRLGIADGSMVAVQGEQGGLRVQARLSEACSPGTVFVPEHLGPESTNLLGARPGMVILVTVKPPVGRAGPGAGEEP